MSHERASSSGDEDTVRSPRGLPAGLLRAASAEFVGTLMFVFLAAGSNVAVTLGGTELTTASRVVAISLGAGLSLTVVIAVTSRLSGGHINPVVTLAALAGGKIEPLPALAYVAAQLLGAVIGAALLVLIAPGGGGGMGATLLAPNMGIASGLLAETVFTFILVFVVFATAMDPRGPRSTAPLAIGLTVLAINLVGAPLTGASMNPARSFGPALIGGHWADHWVYWIAPALGALLAGWIYSKVYADGQDQASESS